MGEEERFAAAVENGTTPAFAGHGDRGADDLSRRLEIVALLRHSGAPALGPEPGARERARQRLMDAFAVEFGHAEIRHGAGDASEPTGPVQVVAPVALATRPEERPEATPQRRAAAPDDRPQRRSGRHSAPGADDEPEATVHTLHTRQAPAQRGGHRRAALLGAAAAAALVALAGGGTFASRDALPGDTMYGVKRVAESTGYALTLGQDAKARRHLEQAQRRLDEVEGMVARDRATTTSGGSAPTPDPALVRNTMQEFDADATEGSRQLLSGPAPDTAQVDEVQTWAQQQSARLSEIRSTLPAQDKADESLALLDQMLGQAEALKSGACVPDAAGSTSGGTSAQADPACAPSADPGAARVTGTETDPQTQDDSTGPSATSTHARSSGGNAATDGAGTADQGDDTQSVDPAEQGTDSTGTSDRRKRDDGSGGGSGGSGGSGAAGGSNDISVPLPVPKVEVPSLVPGLPSVGLGR
jgi:hypothetical protein